MPIPTKVILANKSFFKHFRWAILWMLMVAVLMSLPGSSLSKYNWIDRLMLDKIAHFAVYALMAVLLYLAYHQFKKRSKLSFRIFVLVFLIVAIYSSLLEIFQGLYVPNRTFDRWDLTVNLLGDAFGWFTLVCLKNFYHL